VFVKCDDITVVVAIIVVVVSRRSDSGTDGALQGLVQGGRNFPCGRIQEVGKPKECGGNIRHGRFVQEAGNRLITSKLFSQRGADPHKKSYKYHKLKELKTFVRIIRKENFLLALLDFKT
jgi:hypothetical protein